MFLFMISYFMTVSFIKIKTCFCGNYCIKSLDINVSKHKNKKRQENLMIKTRCFLFTSEARKSIQRIWGELGRRGWRGAEKCLRPPYENMMSVTHC